MIYVYPLHEVSEQLKLNILKCEEKGNQKSSFTNLLTDNRGRRTKYTQIHIAL